MTLLTLRTRPDLDDASEARFEVKSFAANERISRIPRVEIVALHPSSNVDLDAIVGQAAELHVDGGSGPASMRSWYGLIHRLEQVRTEPRGMSTYVLGLTPTLWLLDQRRTYRIFQQVTELDIVETLLGEWKIEHEFRMDRSPYKARKFKVQYGESDYAFLSRLLADLGVSFFFEHRPDKTLLVLTDRPEAADRRAPAIRFFDDAGAPMGEVIRALSVQRRVRPTRVSLRDHDYRKPPSFNLLASAAIDEDEAATPVELESFEYVPGAFLFRAEDGETTPVADDRGKTRTDEGLAKMLAERRLEARRNDARRVELETNAIDLAPGAVFEIVDHPRDDLNGAPGHLVIETRIEGDTEGVWRVGVEAVSAGHPFRPTLDVPRPTVPGVESATVVAPDGEEIHVDEFARVRVHFHWDRGSKMDENSSCWIHVSQSWGGAGFGGVNHPRVGQEVLVEFLGGDPDRPIITGRVYTNLQKVPYKLPENKTMSGWKSSSTGGTGGYNEISFEDKGGGEVVNIQAERDFQKLVKNDQRQTVGNNKTCTVGNNKSNRVGNNHKIHVGGGRHATIGSTDHINPGTSFTAGIGKAQKTYITMSEDIVILADTGGSMITLSGDQLRVTAPGWLILEGNNVSITGKSKVEISAPVVDIKGTPIKLNCT